MKSRRRMIRDEWNLLMLKLSAALAEVGLGKSDSRRVMKFFGKLSPEDQRMFSGNMIRALDQIGLARRYDKHPSLVQIDSNLTRTSDRLFILGSGPSISKLSTEDFAHIGLHDSWGFNFWFVHAFVPTVYFAQVGRKRDRYVDIMTAWETCFQKVSHRYKETRFVLKGGDLLYGYDVADSLAFRQLLEAGVKEISVMPTLLVPKDVNRSAQDLFDDLQLSGLMSHSSGICLPVPQVRSTVGLLFVAAVQMGYREVILCGVDGVNRAHFFDTTSYMAEFPELSAIPESYRIAEHPHSVPESNGVSSLDYLFSLAKFCEERFGIKTSIASSESYLSGKLPCYAFDMHER